MFATTKSSSMIRILFILRPGKEFGGAGHALAQELASVFKFAANLPSQLNGIAQLLLGGLLFKFPQQRGQPANTACAAGAGATMRETPDIVCCSSLDGFLQLIELFGGLRQIESHEFAKIFGRAVGELLEPGHIDRGRRAIRGRGGSRLARWLGLDSG